MQLIVLNYSFINKISHTTMHAYATDYILVALELATLCACMISCVNIIFCVILLFIICDRICKKGSCTRIQFCDFKDV